MLKVIRYAPEAWNMLQGVFCVYKPADMTMNHLRKVVIGNLTRDLNLLKTRPATPIVAIEGSVTEKLVVKLKENYADHPLVLGPRYQPKDIKLTWAHQLDKNISGVCILGVNSGTKGTHKVRESQLIRSYVVSGQFGRTTDTLFIHGKVIGKSTYKHITRGRLMRTLMTIQAGHQRSSLNFLGLDPQSQEAYEALSAEGLVRPGEKSPPLIYALKIVDFNLPDFTLVSCINENAVYLQHLVHDLALRLKTTAVCTQMRCIRYGPWTLQHSLLHKHWCLEHIIDNITHSKPLFKDIIPKSASLFALKDEQCKEF
ncbi:mitochondrial mRNA pseudouridine synthase Trub2-like [Penaeus chinensis]|uniref:mitochondrial mRNA pseudouridine synthase Trub2-like n=1 Tax=Penaeus chinensis TaxID=139456 RepID=UPI001FB8588E|nr:mitochondrial mRNA pseudouridine synthase Trub2-like [Penaeus chinensis]